MTNHVLVDILKSLTSCFPGGFINGSGEFIANKRTNAYFNLLKCDTYFDVCCKIIEQLSRDCSCSMPYSTYGKNDHYHADMTTAVNRFLGTKLSVEDMELVYENLGNGCNHDLTMLFVKSDYDMRVLAGEVAADEE